MRRSHITVGLFLGVTLWSTGFAAAATPAKPLPSVATQADCEKTGSDISALIDASSTSPNISAAKAVFQVGIMNCMEDEPDKANIRYEDARKLLGDRTKAPVSLPKR
jgi:hypothetical protein